MFELNRVSNNQELTEQLSTVDSSVKQQHASIIGSICYAIENLSAVMKSKKPLNLIISGVSFHGNITPSKIKLLQHYLPSDITGNILLTDLNEDLEPIATGSFDIEGTCKSLFRVTETLGEFTQEVHGIFAFNLNFDVLKTHLDEAKFQISLKKQKSKFFIFHNSNRNEYRDQLYLKKYNISVLKAVKNPFSYQVDKTVYQHVISQLDFKYATKNAGFVDSLPILKKVLNNTYFDGRFNAFGLHYSKKTDEGFNKVIFFDHEFCYDPFSFAVYKANKQGLTLVSVCHSDPFVLLSRDLKQRKFFTDEDEVYITLQDKEFAAKLKSHFAFLFQQRNEEKTKRYKALLEKEIGSHTEEMLAQMLTSNHEGYPLRDVTSKDVRAYKLLHHNTQQYIEEVKTDPSLLIARDHLNNAAIFEVAKSDDMHFVFSHFLQLNQELGFDLNSHDNEGYSLLDCAVISGAFKNADLLLKHGFNINISSPFGITPLHRAYEYKLEKAIQFLESRGAQKLKNVFGILPS